MKNNNNDTKKKKKNYIHIAIIIFLASINISELSMFEIYDL